MKSLRLKIWTTFVAVVGLAITTQAVSINLAWNPNTESDLASYVVSYGTQPGNYTTTVDVGNNTSQQVTGLVNGVKYDFVVKAKNSSGLLSVASTEISSIAADPTSPPAAPAGPIPASGANSVALTAALSWAPSASATQYDVAFGMTNPPAIVSSNQTTTSYRPVSLAPGATYYWRIVAKNVNGSTSGPIWILTTAAAGSPVPVAAYAFNEGTGTTVGDASGNARTGALSNATWTTAGKYDGALSFNGSSSRVTVADAAALHLSNAMTLEAWVNPSVAGSQDWQAILYKGVDNYVLATVGSSYAPAAGGIAGGSAVLATSPSALPVNTWTHVATTYDGTTVRLFVNGTQVASQAASGLLAVSTNPLEIGSSLVDGGFFAGLIDDVRVYNTALTPAQIQTDMTTPVASSSSDTQAPTSPTNLVVTAVSTTQLAVTWTAATDNVGVTAYRVERCQGAGCTTFSQVGTATTTSYSDAALLGATSYTYRVRATDAVANLSGYSTVASATTVTPPSPPAVPAGPVPTNGATGAPVNAILSWAASTNATQYDVAFGTTSSPAIVSSNQTSTSYQPVAQIAGTTYYWQVVAKGAGGSTAGPVWSVTTVAAPRPTPIAAYAFNEGTGTTTGDGSGNGRTGTLSGAVWTTAGKNGGALSFNGSSSRVSVADAAALHLSNAMTLEAWVNPSVAGATDWQAIVYKGADNYVLATTGSAYAPTAGTIVGGTLALVTSPSALPLNSWTHMAMTYDGSMVRLFVNGTQVASQPATGLIGVSTSPLEIGSSLVDGGGFGGLMDDVRVYNAALSAAQIQVDMTTPVANVSDTQSPTIPMNLAVTATSTTQLTAAWSASTDNVGVTGYRIERCAGPGCTTFTQVGTPTATNYSDTALVVSTSYTYRARAVDAAGNLSGYSAAATAITLGPVPTAPSGPTPVSNATGLSMTPILSWTASTNATQYDVAFGTANPPAVVSSNQSAITYQPAALMAGTKYYWQVVAKGTGGSTGSVVWNFTTSSAPAAPAGPTPATGATGVSTTGGLSWTASANATQYDVAFGTANPPAVISSNQTSTTYQPVGLAAGITYYWRIVAKGVGGSTSGPVWSLTTAALRPTPIAAYAFNEGTGTTTGDGSGNGRTGTLSGAAWTTSGKNGGALSFNGSSSRVSVADAAALHLSNAMTLEAWVNPSVAGSKDWQAIIYKGADNYVLATTGSWYAPTTGAIVGGTLALVTSPTALPVNTWTHVATSYDGSMVRLFVNGTQVASQPATGLIAVSTNPLEIGSSLVDGGGFGGLIDDVRVYNAALSAAQIQADMTTPVGSGSTPAPAVPSGPLPTSGATNVLTTVALNWAASTNAVQYDVAFGTTNPPPTVATNQTTTYYQPPTAFGYGVTYFWRVTAKGAGGSTSGPMWSFIAQPAGTGGTATISSASSDVQPLRLLTWNVNGGNNAAGAPNVDGQVALMASSGAQVIALQGVTITEAGDLSALYKSKLENSTSRTWNALWVSDPRLAPAKPEGNLLLTTLPITGSATVELDSAPINPTLMDAKRSAGWIAVVFNNVTVRIATTQLAIDATQRQAQLTQLNAWMAAVPTPRLIGGDFNMLPTDGTYRQMASGFKDLWTALVKAGDTGFTQVVSPTQSGRLDYWWSELRDQHVTATAIGVVETTLSNHHAVVIDVNVQ